MTFDQFIAALRETPDAYVAATRVEYPEVTRMEMEESDWWDQFVSYVEIHGVGPPA